MSLPPQAQGSIPGGVAYPLPGRDFHPLEAPDFPWRTVDGVEHFRHSTLGDFVLLGRDPQRSLPTIRFWNVSSTRGLRPVRSAMHPAMQILQIPLEIRLVVLPCHSINPRCGVSAKRQKRVVQPVEGDVVKERAESLVLVPFCSYTHTVQRTEHAQSPALCPGHGVLARALGIAIYLF